MSSLKRTPIYEEHLKLNARMVPFGGWEMPVQYTSILEEHHNTRNHVGLFDVSHMGEIHISGPDATPFLQRIVTQNVEAATSGSHVQYSLLLNEMGGVIDDILIYKFSSTDYLLCVNASNIEKDFNWIQKQRKNEMVTVENRSDHYVQLAIQGPKATPLLQELTKVSLSDIMYYRFAQGLVLSIETIISRTGYTGEDGFEIYLPSEKGAFVFQKLLEHGKKFNLLPCGLGARDTLRIEMRYPLYGHELNESISPLEADLEWVVKWKKGNFIGRQALLNQKENGLKRKLVGFELSNGIPRQDYDIYSFQKKLIGKVTSGTLSPTLKKGIGIGFVHPEQTHIGNEINVMIRSNLQAGKIVKTPFVRK